jgi:hypothetical protein
VLPAAKGRRRRRRRRRREGCNKARNGCRLSAVM